MGRRLEDDVWLIFRGTARGYQEEPAILKFQYTRCAAILAVYGGPNNVTIKGARTIYLFDDEDMCQCDSVTGEFVRQFLTPYGPLPPLELSL